MLDEELLTLTATFGQYKLHNRMPLGVIPEISYESGQINGETLTNKFFLQPISAVLGFA